MTHRRAAGGSTLCYVRPMDIVIPPEFERFAREQVEAGAVSSEEEAVGDGLRPRITA